MEWEHLYSFHYRRSISLEISCTGCGKKYRVDDSRLPASGRAVMKCPGCGVKIEINLPSAREHEAVSSAADGGVNAGTSEAAESGLHSSASVSGTSAAGRSASHRRRDDESDETGLEFFEPGIKTALIFCPDYEASVQIEKGLKQQNFEIRPVSSAREVQVRFRYHIYDLLILYQPGTDSENRLTGILQWINNINMEIRRRVMVIHISMNGNRFDTMQAFSIGVDAAISQLDIAVLPEILEKVQASKHADYRVFNECLDRAKKDAI